MGEENVKLPVTSFIYTVQLILSFILKLFIIGVFFGILKIQEGLRLLEK
jgi:hypothetical protein